MNVRYIVKWSIAAHQCHMLAQVSSIALIFSLLFVRALSGYKGQKIEHQNQYICSTTDGYIQHSCRFVSSLLPMT
jgi:hypothetical protein